MHVLYSYYNKILVKKPKIKQTKRKQQLTWADEIE